jgi:two-component system, NtrC family, sensor kinase
VERQQPTESKPLNQQLISALLVILTAAALIAAGINFQQQRKFRLPDDGVTWVDQGQGTNGSGVNRVVAAQIAAGSPAERAGLKPGDELQQINGFATRTSAHVPRALISLGAWSSANYVVHRKGIEFKSKLILAENALGPSVMYQYVVGLVYISIGLFVYYRRSRAPYGTHFYILCLASFILSTFHYTGKLNNFDKVMYWGNVIAGFAAPTIFLHFSLRFPSVRPGFRHWSRAGLLYVPGLLLLAAFIGFSSGAVTSSSPLGQVRWMLDRGWLLYVGTLYVAGGVVLAIAARRAEDLVERQQLKWLRNGALLGALPFVIFNVIPYSLGAIPGQFMNLAVFSLVLIPLTWAYAILRYRLMDVDLIFQQGYAYTLATLAVIGVLYGFVISVGRLDELPDSTVALLIVIAMFLFQPIRSWIQEILDKHIFYRNRYDYRRTLTDFGRELSRETDLSTMLPSVSGRLQELLRIRDVQFFLQKDGEFYRADLTNPLTSADEGALLDLSFLGAGSLLFFERTRHQLDAMSRDLPASVRETVARLDLTYYFPCTVRGKTVAYLGASRTMEGDFLPSEDVELVTTLAGYAGIAIENALLYRSLEAKITEFERLKEFSENIVESINVGIVAADLDDRVDSWNTRMEQLTGIPREAATGRRLGELFPAKLAVALEHARLGSAAGVEQIFKHELRPSNATSEAMGDDSAQVLANVAIAPLVTREGERIGRLVIFDDITERTVLEQRLQQADKLSSIGLLAAGVAHEVNTPLAVISSYAQMLAKQLGGDDAKSKVLEKIAKQTFRASEIVNSLLNFSRTSKSEYEEIDLVKVIRESLGLLEHQLERGGVGASIEGAQGPLMIRGSAGKLQQVFLNLFLNARDAMETNNGHPRLLRVIITGSGTQARVLVEDTGKGIDAAVLPRIFDPFFTTKGAKKGTGLGLAVSYGIVREHGGTIEVSNRSGPGARFVLEFPLVRQARLVLEKTQPAQTVDPESAKAVNV